MDWVGRGLAWGGGQLRRAASAPPPPAAAAALTITNARTTARSRARPHARTHARTHTHTHKCDPIHTCTNTNTRSPTPGPCAAPRARAQAVRAVIRCRAPGRGGPDRAGHCDRAGVPCQHPPPAPAICADGGAESGGARRPHATCRRAPSGQGPPCRPWQGWEGDGAPDWRGPSRHTPRSPLIFIRCCLDLRSSFGPCFEQARKSVFPLNSKSHRGRNEAD